ncbi:MAG: DUF4037 domain-containing protein [Syntrophobacteraceae bacterium]|nr:DUF4037 domain-containing protein [Syntrophobacteraceae bacterium]
MKGLDLSRRYFHTHGEKMIAARFPGYRDRIAVGLVGEGSECFGFDDEISRDHDWGPGFCLWLAPDDFAAVGSALQAEYEKLPKKFENFQRLESFWGKSRVGVFETGAFYRRFLGLPHVPDDPLKWFYIPEANLAACTNGRVFHDPCGKFSAIREGLLAFFPEDVRLAKIALCCASAAQAGQYNLRRMIGRGQIFPAQYAVTKFSSEIIALGFLLNRCFRPFYKWSHHAVRSLSLMGDFLYSRIEDLAVEPDMSKKMNLIEKISAAVIGSLRLEHLSTLDSDFLLDHANEIARKISDPRVLERIKPLGER